MNSKKYGQSNSSAEGRVYGYQIDSCNHLISTSLKDLSAKYQDLSSETTDSTGRVKNDLTIDCPKEESDLR